MKAMNFRQTKHLVFLFFCIQLLFAFRSAQAAIPTITEATVLNILTAAMQPTADKILKQTTGWLGFFLTLQFVLTNYKLLPSLDLDAVFAKFIGSMTWAMACIYIMTNGPAFINNVANQFLDLAGISLPTPGSILTATVGITASILGFAVPVGAASSVSGNWLEHLAWLVLFAGGYLSVKIFMLQLEIGLVVMLSPLSFSMLGLNALRDQGIAPLKALISLVYRIVIATLILAAFTAVSSVVSTIIKNTSTVDIITGLADFGKLILSAVALYGLMVGALYKSDSIAASLSSGSTSMGAGDVAGAAAAGAAAGSAASAAKETANPIQGMSSWMQQAFGGSNMARGNASTSGAADALDAAPLKPDMSSASLSGIAQGPADAGNAGVKASGADQGSGSTQLGEFAGVPNQTPGAQAPQDPERASAREARRAERGGSGPSQNPSIGGAQSNVANRPGPGLLERLDRLNQHVTQEKVATHVSINTHHD